LREVVPRPGISPQPEKRANGHKGGCLGLNGKVDVLRRENGDLWRRWGDLRRGKGHRRPRSLSGRSGDPRGRDRDPGTAARPAGGSGDALGHDRNPWASGRLARGLSTGAVLRHPAAVAPVRLAPVQRMTCPAKPRPISLEAHRVDPRSAAPIRLDGRRIDADSVTSAPQQERSPTRGYLVPPGHPSTRLRTGRSGDLAGWEALAGRPGATGSSSTRRPVRASGRNMSHTEKKRA
jgi:hypothetical protein